jgi:hypothetical protein
LGIVNDDEEEEEEMKIKRRGRLGRLVEGLPPRVETLG